MRLRSGSNHCPRRLRKGCSVFSIASWIWGIAQRCIADQRDFQEFKSLMIRQWPKRGHRRRRGSWLPRRTGASFPSQPMSPARSRWTAWSPRRRSNWGRVRQQFVCRQAGRLVSVEDRLRDIRGEIAEADQTREVRWADAFAPGQFRKPHAVRRRGAAARHLSRRPPVVCSVPSFADRCVENIAAVDPHHTRTDAANDLMGDAAAAGSKHLLPNP